MHVKKWQKLTDVPWWKMVPTWPLKFKTKKIFLKEMEKEEFAVWVTLHFFSFSSQVLSQASVENWREYPLNTSRPSLDVWDGSSPLYPVYHTVSERWIHRTRWKQSHQTHEMKCFLTSFNWTEPFQNHQLKAQHQTFHSHFIHSNTLAIF